MNRKLSLKQIEAGIRFFLLEANQELRMGEKFVLITIIRLLDEKHVISKNQVCFANGVKRDTTYHLMLSLERKGYLKSQRSRQFFSYSYISLTNKGLQYASKLKKIVMS